MIIHAPKNGNPAYNPAVQGKKGIGLPAAMLYISNQKGSLFGMKFPFFMVF